MEGRALGVVQGGGVVGNVVGVVGCGVVVVIRVLDSPATGTYLFIL